MNQSIKSELLEHIETTTKELRHYKELPKEVSDLKHNITAFQGMEYVHTYESFHFGEKRDYTDAEALVNMIVYIKGEELLYELESEIYAK